jgi:hypothetical protein
MHCEYLNKAKVILTSCRIFPAVTGYSDTTNSESFEKLMLFALIITNSICSNLATVINLNTYKFLCLIVIISKIHSNINLMHILTDIFYSNITN